nr:site-specific integrase [Pseudomarimonas arenosa]
MCSQVFLYAVATGRCDSDPVASLPGALPSAKVTHRPAVTALLRSLHGYVGQPAACAALKLLPLLFLRSGELRMAKWSEIDLEAAEWRIPAQTGRTKFKTGEHWVPLAPHAVAILTDLQAVTARCRHVFPGIRHGSKSMSANTVNAALRTLGYDSATMCGHGFRALASTRLNEMGFNPDVIERQLGHKEQDQVRAAYDRAQHRDSRRQMMLAWADYLDKLREGSTVQNSMAGGRRANG